MCALLTLLWAAPLVYAQQTLTWDANGATSGTGGTGIWNTTATLWRNGVTLIAWNNSLLDSAIFGGTAGTVTLGVPVTAQNLTFNVAFTLTGSTLTLAGAAPEMRLTSGTSTVASAVTGAAGLTTTGGGSLLLDGVNSYSGGLTLTGTGTVTLTKANTYTGTTTIQSGTLQIGNTGPAGDLAASTNVVNNGALRINRTGTVTIGQIVSGTGSLTKLGSGIAILTADNTYTGTTTISAGVLRLGAGGTAGKLGTGNVSVAAGASLLIDRSDTVTLGQIISGTGNLTQFGTGTTILTGANTYSTTTISAGTLQIGAGGTTGSLSNGAVTVAANSTLAVNRSDTLTLGNPANGTGVISGLGGVTQAGTGTTILGAKNTYSGATTISAGTLQLGSNSSFFGQLGSGPVINNGILRFSRHFSESDGRTIPNVISGTGSLVQAGVGQIALTGTNTYTGLTTTNVGSTLALGPVWHLSTPAGGPTGDVGASSQVVNNGVLQINRTTAMTLGQTVSGSGTLNKYQTSVTTLTGDNTYSGGTLVNAGTLQVGDGGTTGTVGSGGVLVNAGGLLAFNRGNTLNAVNAISGAGAVAQIGTGTTVLTGNSTYTGGTTISGGTLQVGNGGATGNIVGNVTDNGVLAFNRSNDVIFGGVIAGSGRVVKDGAGALTLTGNNTYAGVTSVNAGTLLVNGALASAAVNVATGATVGGTGTIGGAVSVGSGGTIAPGASPGTLTVGSLILTPGSQLTYELGTPNVVGGLNDRIAVIGDLTLGGTLQITDTGSFASTPGSYRLIDYGGILTGAAGDLALGATPGYAPGDALVQTTIAGQVNLITSQAGLPVAFWDGAGAGGDSAIAGGSGPWNASQGNWTNVTGSINQGWVPGMGIFTGGAGVVTLGETVDVRALQFSTTGYAIEGNGQAIRLLGMPDGTPSLLRVDAGSTATIGTALVGTAGLEKADAGTLRLSANNTYSGDTVVSGGTLQIGDGGSTGTLGSGAVRVDAGGVLVFNRSNTYDVSNTITGAGALAQSGTGTTVLTGAASHTGGTTISGGTLQIGSGGTAGSIVGNVSNDGTLAFNRSDGVTFGGVIAGAGAVAQVGTGTTVLTGNSTYTGGTTISGGTLQVGNGGATGNIVGNVTDNGMLAFNRSDDLTFGGVIAGSGRVVKDGAGALTLTGDSTYTGGTTISGGTLQIGSGGTTGSIVGNVSNDGTLAFNRSDDLTFGGVMAGAGALAQSGTGTTVLTGAASHTGGTTISRGTLQIGSGGTAGSIVGNVSNDGTLAFNRSDDVTFGGVIAGAGAVAQVGTGTTVLIGNSMYTGGTTISGGTLQIGSGGTAGGIVGNVSNDGTLGFNRSDDVTFGGVIAGSGRVVKDGVGALTLTGSHTYTGVTSVNAGTLLVNGALASVAVNVATGATLGGTGTIGGAVTVGPGGAIAPGVSASMLTVGALNLSPTSVLNYELGAAGSRDGIVVNGDLGLDGVLNVTDVGGFGLGTYRMMNYGGVLTDGGLAFGVMPEGYAYEIQNGSGQVNMIVLAASSLNTIYWDGSGPGANGVVNGGSGVWAARTAKWTDATGRANAAWAGQLAVFQGPAGVVMVEDTVTFTGMQFKTDGYVVAGGVLRTNTQGTQMRVDSGATGTIAATITGSGGLVKQDGGRLVLTGSNTYTGDTEIAGGTLSISADQNLGASAGLLTLSGGTLQTTADLTSGRAMQVTSGGGTLESVGSTTFRYAGAIDGEGSVTKAGAGTLLLTGANTYRGGTVIDGGLLRIGDCGTSGSLTGDVVNGGVMAFSRSDTSTFGGSISGTGAVIKECTGTQVVTGVNSYTGGTMVRGGTLRGNAASLQGDILTLDRATLLFDQGADAVFHGTLFGAGTVTKTDRGTLQLTGEHPFQGLMTVDAGTLALDGSVGGRVNVASGATLDATGSIGGALTVAGTLRVASPASGGFGTLTVGGDVSLAAGARYGMMVGADGSGSLLLVAGDASLAGATIAIDPQVGAYGRVTHYPVLYTTGGLTPTAAVTSTVATLEPWLTHNAPGLFLTVLNIDLPLAPFATTANGASLARVFDRLRPLRPGATGDLAAVARELTALDDPGLATALDAVSGEIHASASQLAALDGEAAADLIRGQLAARPARRGPEGAVTTSAAPWGGRRRWWARWNGQRADFGAGTVHGADARLQGLAVGVDGVLADRWLVGGGGAYSTGDLRLEGLPSSSDFTAPRAFGYVGYTPGWWAAHVGAGVARTAYDTKRAFSFTARTPAEFGATRIFGGIEREATSRSSGQTREFWGEGRLNLAMGSWTFNPSTGLRYARYGRGAWSERGAGTLSFAAPHQEVRSAQADAGVGVTREGGRLRPFASTSYRRELTDRRTAATLQLGDQQAGLFEIDGLLLARDSVTGRAGMTFETERLDLSLVYEGRRAPGQTRHTFQLAFEFE